MLLRDVLHILANFGKEIGLNHNDLYIRLFGVEDLNLEQTVKNLFLSRALNQTIYKKVLTDEGFVNLCLRIKGRYLAQIGKHYSLYSALCGLIDNDTQLRPQDKKLLIASFNPDQEDQLAQFIALCIICGNYNTQQAAKTKSNKKELDTSNEYGINIKHYAENTASLLFEYILWAASQADFFASRSEGKRFASLNIIQQLLPKGYIAEPNFQMRGKTESGSISKIIDICRSSTRNISVIGDGGIGKTTFLHQLMTEEYSKPNGDTLIPSKYMSGRPIPFFIELNRCPDRISEWYDDTLRKTNFITRYIGQIVENHKSLQNVSPDLLDQIEKEFQKVPADGSPRYLLLLDGFNEVAANDGYSIRSSLSNEISILSDYPNVQIITTSRETQAAYYAVDFENVRLIGLEDQDITSYLARCGRTETQIGIIMSCKPLIEILRIPLYLCMFCAENVNTNEPLPETGGEILYFFFHRKSTFYNIRSRAEDTRTNPLDKYQTAFVLDFVLPYIAWHYEKEDCFYINSAAFEQLIRQSILCMDVLCRGLTSIPYADFQYQPAVLYQTIQSFYTGQDINVSPIINCVGSYLGIVYEYTESSGPFGERNRYSFQHHHFRDYFSAIWDIQLLNLLNCMNVPQFYTPAISTDSSVSCNMYLNTSYWRYNKSVLISEILMEHRNAPVLDKMTSDWILPYHNTDEQNVLDYSLDFCRKLCAENKDIHYLLSNVLSSILAGRKELTGVDLSCLDLNSCCFFNVNCSRRGKNTTLSADFSGSHIYSHNFEPEGHQDSVIDTIYLKNNCFTLDDFGCIKCWDILSGKLEYTIYADDPTGIHDLSDTGYMQISPDGKWLATKLQKSTADGLEIGLNIYNIESPDKHKETYYVEKAKKALNSFSFTGDSKGILIVYDYKNISGITLQPLHKEFDQSCSVLMKDTRLYAADLYAPIYTFTAEYNPYDWDNWYTESYQEDEEEESDIPIPCQLYMLSSAAKEETLLHTFMGMPQTVPTAKYIPAINSFLYFNNETLQIEQYNCTSGMIRPVYKELTADNDMPPSYIHIHPENPSECYFMYPDNCYLVDLTARYGNGILMKYPLAGVRKLLSESEQGGELYFKTSVVPSRNRFQVSNDTTTYEWNADEDTLVPRYNMQYYSCTALISDPGHRMFFLVHQYNGISIFSGDPIRLTNSICFYEHDYYIGNCCYNEASQMLALTFVRSDHEKVIILDMVTSEQSTIFSTTNPDETVENLCFQENSDFLLISTQYQCCEYNLSTDTLYHIKEAGENERLAGSNYNGKSIEIVVTQHMEAREPVSPTRCEQFKRKGVHEKISYSREWYYILPELTEELYPFFIFFHGDLGMEGTHGETEMQNFWITNGFFLNPSSIDSFTLPILKCYSDKGRPLPDRQLQPLQTVYFRHTKALEYKYREETSNFSYTYLNEQTKEAVFMQNSLKLYYTVNYHHCTYTEIKNGFMKDIGSYDGHAYWDFAIPWGKDKLIGCYENFRLELLDSESGKEIRTIEYTPGNAIQDCCFTKSIGLKDLLIQLNLNGGIIEAN